MWNIGSASNSVSKWHMGLNSEFKGLNYNREERNYHCSLLNNPEEQRSISEKLLKYSVRVMRLL